MKGPNEQKTKKLITDVIVVSAIVGIIALIIFVLTYRRETHIYETHDNGEASALVCTTNSNDDETDFFSSDSATGVEHRLKLAYNDGKVEKISYEFDGKYDSEEQAKEDKGKFNTDFNLYMGGHGVKYEVLAPVFQFTDNKASVRLYLDDYKNMNSVIARLFYIGSSSIDTIGKNSAEETKKYYEKKGFSCIISE